MKREDKSVDFIDRNSDVELEVFQVDLFPKGKSFLGAVGTAFILVKIGLATHYASYDIFPDDIDDSGDLKRVSKERALNMIEFPFDLDVKTCLEELKELSLIDSDYEFQTIWTDVFRAQIFAHRRLLASGEYFELSKQDSAVFIEAKKIASTYLEH